MPPTTATPHAEDAIAGVIALAGVLRTPSVSESRTGDYQRTSAVVARCRVSTAVRRRRRRRHEQRPHTLTTVRDEIVIHTRIEEMSIRVASRQDAREGGSVASCDCARLGMRVLVAGWDLLVVILWSCVVRAWI